jgi:hypothetical protein
MNGAVHTGQELFWQDGYGAISRRLPNINGEQRPTIFLLTQNRHV